jgi:hypothetical protein
MKESTINDSIKIGNTLQKAFDECGIESITPFGNDMFIGYQGENFVFNQCNIKTKENEK